MGSLAPRAWNRHLATIGAFLAWCRRHGWPAGNLELRADRRVAPDDYTRAIPLPELERLWARADIPLRERALWRLLYDSAARAARPWCHRQQGHPLVTALAMRLVAELGYPAAAIDFPNHGERRPEEERSVPAAEVRSAMGLVAWRQRNTQATEQAISDLRATVDFACERSDVNPGLVGYIGLSMGTRFGVPFVAAEPRVKAAVLGLFGWSADLRRPDEEGLAERSQAFAAAARTIRAPALFLLQWDDELFPRQDGLALYDLLGSPEKTLHANPGGHIALPPAEVADIIQFVRRHLAGTGLTAKATASASPMADG